MVCFGKRTGADLIPREGTETRKFACCQLSSSAQLQDHQKCGGDLRRRKRSKNEGP